MKTKNVFAIAKTNHKTALQNLGMLHNQNEQMISLSLKEMEEKDNKLGKDYAEWLDDTQKAFNDYQDLIVKGLDYLSVCLDKAYQQTPR